MALVISGKRRYYVYSFLSETFLTVPGGLQSELDIDTAAPFFITSLTARDVSSGLFFQLTDLGQKRDFFLNNTPAETVIGTGSRPFFFSEPHRIAAGSRMRAFLSGGVSFDICLNGYHERA